MSLIDNASSTKGKILIIDDESEVREVLASSGIGKL